MSDDTDGDPYHSQIIYESFCAQAVIRPVCGYGKRHSCVFQRGDTVMSFCDLSDFVL